MKGWCQLALKVFLYTCEAVIGGLCVAFGIGPLTASQAASAVTSAGAVNGLGTAADSTVGTVGSTAGQLVSTVTGLPPAPLPILGGTPSRNPRCAGYAWRHRNRQWRRHRNLQWRRSAT